MTSLVGGAMTDCARENGAMGHRGETATDDEGRAGDCISRDLRQAIEMLESVPFERRRPHKKHDDDDAAAFDRLPLRSVNRHRHHRLSLPPQTSEHTDVDAATTQSFAVRMCSSMNDDDVCPTDNAATVEQKTAETSDRSSDASKYILPWKIRRVKKHKLDRMQAPPSSSSSLREGQRHRHSASVDGRAQMSSDSTNDDDDNGRQSASSESLDSIVERILEDAATDAERKRWSKRKAQRSKVASNGVDCQGAKRDVDRLNRVHPDNEEQRATPSDNERHSKPQHNGIVGPSAGAKSRRQRHRRPEKTLEDLFEEAVESLRDGDGTFNYPSLLRDDVEYLSESVPPAPHHRRLRSAENWERQIYDSEVHDQCRHHRLQAYTMRDVATISRGFSLVQKHDKTKTPNADTRRSNEENMDYNRSKSTLTTSGSERQDDTGSDVTFVKRVAISAKAAASTSGSQMMTAMDDHVDLGLDVEVIANQHRRTSRSSWDSVSVDSLVMYDDDDVTVHAASAAAAAAACSKSATVEGQLDNDFVSELQRLHDKWQQSQAKTETNDDDDVWICQQDTIKNGTVTDDRQLTAENTTLDKPETVALPTSTADPGGAVVLSDCVTSQQVTINIRLPRRSRQKRHKQHSVPTVPFRELRLRREVRYADDVEARNSFSAIASAADVCALPRDVATNSEGLSTPEGRVVLTVDNLLSSDELSTLFEVDYDSRDSSRSVEIVPVFDSVRLCPTSRHVDVSRSEATRVVRLPTTASSRVVYYTPSLVQTVEHIRRVLLGAAAAAPFDGVSVSCDAVETVSRRGDKLAPVVRNIFVDCLLPLACHHDNDAAAAADDDDGDIDSENINSTVA